MVPLQLDVETLFKNVIQPRQDQLDRSPFFMLLVQKAIGSARKTEQAGRMLLDVLRVAKCSPFLWRSLIVVISLLRDFDSLRGSSERAGTALPSSIVISAADDRLYAVLPRLKMEPHGPRNRVAIESEPQPAFPTPPRESASLCGCDPEERKLKADRVWSSQNIMSHSPR